MKKFFCIFFAVLFMLSSVMISASAEENNVNDVQTVECEDGTTVTYFEDGSVLEVSPAKEIESSIATRSGVYDITASRDVTYYAANGQTDWVYTLTASFTYVPGASSICTKASYTTEIFASGWSFSDGAAIDYGNVATGNGKFVFSMFFINIRTYIIDITITCDTYGNLT